jgi:hypothetical protein
VHQRTPTVTTTERIVATGTSAYNQDLRIDLGGGPLAPGRATPQASGSPEIALDVNLGEPAAGAARGSTGTAMAVASREQDQPL